MALNFSTEVFTRNRFDLVPASLDKTAAAFIGCMDEAIMLGDNTVHFGVAGTGITSPRGGDESVFPVEDRIAFQQVMPIAADILKRQTRRWGLELYTTWHPGCAAAGKQGIEPESVGRLTEEYSKVLGLSFAGGLPISEKPQVIRDTKILAGFRRPVEDHVHDARIIIASTGGGINDAEISRIEYLYGPALTISVDWVAASKRALPVSSTTAMLERQFVIGQAIAPAGVDTPIHFFDAGRLGSDQAGANEYYVRKLLSR